VSTAIRSESPHLALVAPERLLELAEGQEHDGQGESPKPVNGAHLHPDCPDCGGD
jgi:hypothetical protein